MNTSIEQSNHLLELGLNPKTADMYYQYIGYYDSFDKEWIDRYLTYPRFVGDIQSKNVDINKSLPCWSFRALLELMPFRITNKGGITCYLGLFKDDNKYWIQYFHREHGGGLVETTGDNPIDAAYNMICWLLENKYL